MKNNRIPQGVSTDALLLTIVKLVTISLSFVITRLLSQYLSVYDYGTYSQILLLVSTVSSVTVLGMIDGVNFYFCSIQDSQKREAYVSTLFALQGAVSTVAGAVILLLTGPISGYFDNPDVSELIIFAAALPLLQNLLSMIQALLVSVGKARMLAMRNFLVALVRLAVVLVVTLVVHNIAIVLATTLVLDIVQVALFGAILAKNQCTIRIKSVDLGLVKQIMRYCAPLALFISMKALNRDLDKYLIGIWTDTETLAVYSNASKPLPFDVIMYSFYTVLVPEITRRVAVREQEGAVSLYRVFLEIACIATVVPCCAALAASPQLLQLLYTKKYMEGLSIFCNYILVDLLQFTNITLILSAAGKTGLLMLIGGGALALNGVLNVVFYQYMGVVGPAVATLIVTLATGVLMLGLSARELGAKLRDFFDRKFLLLFMAENVAAVFLSGKLQQWLTEKNCHYLLILVLICGLYCAVFFLLHGRRLIADMKQLNREAKK